MQAHTNTDIPQNLESSIETKAIIIFQISQLVRNSFPEREASQDSHTFEVSIKKTGKKALDRHVKMLLSRIPQRRRDRFHFRIPFLALLLTISPISLSQFNYFLSASPCLQFSRRSLRYRIQLFRFRCRVIDLRLHIFT